VLQFTEGFSDRQAADAVRGRIDWKYALGLELADAGFDHTVLSEFRTRLVQGKLELVLLDVLLDRVHELGLLMAVRVRLRESPTVTSSRSMLSMQNLTSSRERPRKNWNGR
jgi:transposase